MKICTFYVVWKCKGEQCTSVVRDLLSFCIDFTCCLWPLFFFILKLDSTFSPSSSDTHTHAAWAVRNDGLGGRNPSPVFCKTLPLAGSHPPLTRTRPLPRAFSAGIVVTASKMKMELQFLAKALRDLVAASVVITAANSGARPAILPFVVCRS